MFDYENRKQRKEDDKQRNEDEKKLEEVLKSSLVSQHFWRSAYGQIALFGVFLAIAAVVDMGYSRFPPHVQSALHTFWASGAEVAGFIAASVAALFALYQWFDARRESSLEKFYERLNLTNAKYGDWKHARELVPQYWGTPAPPDQEKENKKDFQTRMYTFLELDNLEYMIIRYRLGFVRKHLMFRAVRTFASRCESPAFRELASKLVSGSGYEANTKRLVGQLTKVGGYRPPNQTPSLPARDEHTANTKNLKVQFGKYALSVSVTIPRASASSTPSA